MSEYLMAAARHYRPGLLGRDYVIPQAQGLKGCYLDWFGMPDVRLQVTALYLYQALLDFPFNSLLDVGCGTGTLTNLLAAVHHNSSILGIDRDEQAIAYAKKLADQNHLSNARFQMQDLESEFPAGAYDIITCMAVLQFIHDPEALFQNIYRALSKDGYLMMQVPRLSKTAYLMKSSKAVKRLPEFHEARGAFGDDEIIALLTQSGFEIVRMQPIIKSASILAKEVFYLLLSIHPKLIFVLCPLLNRLTAFDERYAGEGQGLFIIAQKISSAAA
ncbi:MAG: class I SAM-dependent methyltransferase [Acidobacteria bacterium]|nr:class I SAM-dependent methyltransferase [Acidobacteriota bacterium]